MTEPEEAVVARNRAQQLAWYGEALGETVRRVTTALRLTQAELAAVVGISPPMLSQLASARRAKIANPSVLARLQALSELAAWPDLAAAPAEEVLRRIEEVRHRSDTGALTTGTGTTAPRGAAAVTLLLRALVPVADAPRLAVDLEAGGSPAGVALAVVVRTYLLGPPELAEAHYRVTTSGGPGG